MNESTTDFPAISRLASFQGIGSKLGGGDIPSARMEGSPGLFAEMLLVGADPRGILARRIEQEIEDYQVHRMIERVAVTVGEPIGAKVVRPGGTRQRSEASADWRPRAVSPAAERYFRQREYVGRVRAVDSSARVFTAVLGSRQDDPDAELIATLSLELLDSRQRDRLTPGAVFTLVTGYRKTFDSHGRVLKSSLDTRLFLQEPRSLSPARRAEAHAVADHLFDDEE